MTKNVLFVCNSAVNRSPSFTQLVNDDFGIDLFCQAAGTHAYREYDQIQPNTCEWADVIFCATAQEAMWLIDKMGPDVKPKIGILGLGDDYDYLDKNILTVYDIFHKHIFANMAAHSKAEENAKFGG